MSQDLIVIQFDDAAEAGAALQAIRDQHKENQIHLNDTAIVRKDPDGKIHKVNELSSATEIGAVAGGTLGLLLMFMFPIAGVAIGAASGAAIGAALGKGVDGKWVKEVTESLKPGTSALFLVFDQLDAVGDARARAVPGPPAADDAVRRPRTPVAPCAPRFRKIGLRLDLRVPPGLKLAGAAPPTAGRALPALSRASTSSEFMKRKSANFHHDFTLKIP